MRPTLRDQCHVCSSRLESPWSFTSNIDVNCPRCGHFGLTLAAEIALPDLLTTPRKEAVLSYGIRKTPRLTGLGSPTRVFDADECKKLLTSMTFRHPRSKRTT